MNEGLFVYRFAAHTLLGVRENATWAALRAHADQIRGSVGNVYRGRVVRVVAGMQAAFVDVGLGRTAFLHLDDALPLTPLAAAGAAPAKAAGPGKAKLQIDQVLRVHDTVLVQVRKEPLGDKGARVTCHIALSGRFVVLLPKAQHVAISQRIEAGPRREALRGLLERHAPNVGGLVARTAAFNADDGKIEAEIAALRTVWTELLARFGGEKKPALLSVAQAPAVQRCVELVAPDPDKVPTLVSNEENFAALVADALDERGQQVHLLCGPNVNRGAKQGDKLGFFRALATSLRREVPLASGGSLSIDECEAMTVVDVNSGKFVGKTDVATTMLALNLEAAHEVARQLQLRGIGGIVVVDFVDMKSPADRTQVAKALRDALATAPGKSYVSQMSELGLVQLTRRRTQPSLRDSLTEPCPTCHGRGRTRAPWQVACEALEAAAHALHREPAATLLLNVAPAVADVLFGAAKDELAAVEARHGCAILPVARAHFGPERFEVLTGARPGSVDAHDLSK